MFDKMKQYGLKKEDFKNRGTDGSSP
jgi:hypothetical protein